MRTLVWAGLLLAGMASCTQAEKDYPATDPRLQTRKYCNNPSAVNYNWNFPGTPDNSTCFYGADLFAGAYRYRDSVYATTGDFDSAGSVTEYLLNVQRLDSNKVGITGFCALAGTLRLTAPRTGFRAILDSTGLKGQLFCRVQDTVNGYITRDLADTTSIKFFLTVVSDTGTTLHRGTAYRR